MTRAFFCAPVSVATDVSPRDATQFRPAVLPERPSDLIAYWALGGDASCLTDEVSGHILTPFGAALTYYADYITTADGGLNGLITDIQDAALTQMAIIRSPGSTGHVHPIFGTQTNGGSRGAIAYIGTSGQVGTSTGTITGNDEIVPAAPNGGFLCAGLSQTSAERRLFIGSGDIYQSAAKAGSETVVAGVMLGLGAVSYNSAAWLYGLDIAAYLVAPQKSLDEMMDYYLTLKLWQMDRGLSVF